MLKFPAHLEVGSAASLGVSEKVQGTTSFPSAVNKWDAQSHEGGQSLILGNKLAAYILPAGYLLPKYWGLVVLSLRREMDPGNERCPCFVKKRHTEWNILSLLRVVDRVGNWCLFRLGNSV